MIDSGAKNILVVNMPDLSTTPFGLSSPAATQAGLHALAVGFNAALAADLSALSAAHPGVHLYTLDAFNLLHQIEKNPARFGFSNVTQEGILSPTGPQGFLFWDDVHPTTEGHGLIAAGAFAAVTPEPSSLTLAALGFAALAGSRLRRRRT